APQHVKIVALVCPKRPRLRIAVAFSAAGRNKQATSTKKEKPMYAVIRAGGRQFRVAPGDVIKVDQKPAENGKVEFTNVLAVSGEPGALVRPQSGARVVGTVMEEGRGDKILVFHFK